MTKNDNSIPRLEAYPEDIKHFEKTGKLKGDFEVCSNCTHYDGMKPTPHCAGCVILVSDSDFFFGEDRLPRKRYIKFYNYEQK